MMDRWCEVCAMSHDRCGKCGALVVASVTLHRTVNAHGNGVHWCGQDNPRYMAALEAMRQDYNDGRNLLVECPTCQDDCIRRANSPVLYDVHGYYGLQGETAVHQCMTAPEPEPVPVVPAHQEPAVVGAPTKRWRVIP